MNTYIYVLKLAPRLYDDHAWTLADNQAVEAHFQRLKRDFEQGIVNHVGRTLDPKFDGFGLVVFKAENDEAADIYVQDDPAVKGGQMTALCLPYKVVFQS